MRLIQESLTIGGIGTSWRSWTWTWIFTMLASSLGPLRMKSWNCLHIIFIGRLVRSSIVGISVVMSCVQEFLLGLKTWVDRSPWRRSLVGCGLLLSSRASASTSTSPRASLRASCLTSSSASRLASSFDVFLNLYFFLNFFRKWSVRPPTWRPDINLKFHFLISQCIESLSSFLLPTNNLGYQPICVRISKRNVLLRLFGAISWCIEFGLRIFESILCKRFIDLLLQLFEVWILFDILILLRSSSLSVLTLKVLFACALVGFFYNSIAHIIKASGLFHITSGYPLHRAAAQQPLLRTAD